MCTLVVLHRAIPGVRLVAAANRDEFLARHSEGPALRRTPGGVSVVAPRDVRGGGTWLGISSTGLFAALTNVAGGEPDPARRSRGWLVLDALEAGSAKEAADRVLRDATDRYNPFNLFVSDPEEAWAVTCRREARSLALGPGAHVIGNCGLDAPPTPKVARMRERVGRLVGEALPVALGELEELCRGHREGDPLGSACVHTERYGTRSSALLALSDEEGRRSFRFANGAPCETGYDDFTPLLHELARGARDAEGEIVARKVS